MFLDESYKYNINTSSDGSLDSLFRICIESEMSWNNIQEESMTNIQESRLKEDYFIYNEGIKDFFSKIIKWIKDKIKAIVDWFKGLFGKSKKTSDNTKNWFKEHEAEVNAGLREANSDTKYTIYEWKSGALENKKKDLDGKINSAINSIKNDGKDKSLSGDELCEKYFGKKEEDFKKSLKSDVRSDEKKETTFNKSEAEKAISFIKEGNDKFNKEVQNIQDTYKKALNEMLKEAEQGEKENSGDKQKECANTVNSYKNLLSLLDNITANLVSLGAEKLADCIVIAKELAKIGKDKVKDEDKPKKDDDNKSSNNNDNSSSSNSSSNSNNNNSSNNDDDERKLGGKAKKDIEEWKNEIKKLRARNKEIEKFLKEYPNKRMSNASKGLDVRKMDMKKDAYQSEKKKNDRKIEKYIDMAYQYYQVNLESYFNSFGYILDSINEEVYGTKKRRTYNEDLDDLSWLD